MMQAHEQVLSHMKYELVCTENDARNKQVVKNKFYVHYIYWLKFHGKKIN